MKLPAITLALLSLQFSAAAQDAQPVWSVGFMKAHPGKLDSAALSLHMNWGEAREFAKAMGFVASYRLLKLDATLRTSLGKKADDFDLLLITEYPSEEAFNNREKNFQVVFDKHQPGYNLLNGKKPGDFAVVRFELAFRTFPPFPQTPK